MSGLLEVKNLSVSFHTPQGELQAVRDVSFSLKAGEILALVGESGCGKSVLCKSIMKLLPDTAWIKGGSIVADGVDITGCREREMLKLRGKLFSMVLQDPLAALNPTITAGEQAAEAVRIHHPKLSREEVYGRVIKLMKLTGIRQPKERYGMYPHQFSGGMRQRIVMAAALASEPKILLADEPTTALDVTVQAQILDLLREIQRKMHTAALLVSHDLGVVARAADRAAVMYAGKIVEIGTVEEIFYDPRHPYTWGLLRALPYGVLDKKQLYAIPGMPPALVNPPKGDAFACRNEYALAVDYEEEPPMFPVTDTHFAATWLLDKRAPKIAVPAGVIHKRKEVCPVRLSNCEQIPMQDGMNEQKEVHAVRLPDCEQIQVQDGMQEWKEEHPVLLDVRHLTHEFRLAENIVIRALDDVSFQIRRGEVFGLAGESGSGKSTVLRCVMNIWRPLCGEIFYDGINVCDARQYRRNRKMLQAERQMIFQDCASSLNPRMKTADIIAEPLAVSHKVPPRGSYRAEAEFQLHHVGMDASYLDKYPSELSGGMRQRVAIARALAMEPGLLAADEPTASLDVSIQAQILNLFRHLQKEHGFTFLFAAHDLSIVRYLCDRVGVMYQGKMVEIAPTEELFANPLHPYTKSLLSAIPIPDPAAARAQKPRAFEEKDFRREGKLEMAGAEHFVLR